MQRFRPLSAVADGGAAEDGILWFGPPSGSVDIHQDQPIQQLHGILFEETDGYIYYIYTYTHIHIYI